MWQATEGIFDALFGVGLLPVPIGFAALGVAMLGSPAFGRGFGGVSVVVGVVAASILLVDPLSERVRWRSRAHRLPYRPGMEALQSVESP
jgi:hypothetical protein